MINPLPYVRSALAHLSSVVWLLVHTVQEMGDHIVRGRSPIRLVNFFQQTDRTGVGSIPIVAKCRWAWAITDLHPSAGWRPSCLR